MQVKLYMCVHISIKLYMCPYISKIIYVCTYRSEIDEGDPKVLFSIATTSRFWRGTTPFRGFLHFILDPYLIMLSDNESLVSLHLELNPSLLGHWRIINSLGQYVKCYYLTHTSKEIREFIPSLGYSSKSNCETGVRDTSSRR